MKSSPPGLHKKNDRDLPVGPDRIPVVLVHGWNSHPGVWKPLINALEKESVPVWNFAHDGNRDLGVRMIAHLLQDYLVAMRKEAQYPGPVDFVCHSMGNAIVRYLLEVLDGTDRKEKVRFFIMLGPPNKGSAMAEIFHDPVHGPEVLRTLEGVFVPPSFNPLNDPLIQDIRPGSRFLSELGIAGLRYDIKYRIFISSNWTRDPDFFPQGKGKTWEIAEDGGWSHTFAGDGVIPHSEAKIPGVTTVVLPGDPLHPVDSPGKYCHIYLPKNQEIIGQVKKLLIQGL